MWKRGKLKAILTMVLAIGLTSVFVGDSAGSVPGMDTDLGDSDASFLGEEAFHFSGHSIAGAGDVNGDGFDDILINTFNEYDQICQIYLILGKSSGWSMDTNLSNSTASFEGNSAGDWVGVSVAGAGDVNGDGYDDILIGAQHDDWDNGTGQTYLIFGKASGWSMHTDLSNANASFWGEEARDQSGYSVAGAGDVNGDGYDDILIGANQNDDGVGDAGQTYLILGKASGWRMDTDLSDADASFWGEDAGDQSGCSVAGAGDVNGDLYDDFLIGSRFNNDNGNNAGQTYLILGKASGWSMDTILSKADASFWGENELEYCGHSVAGAGDLNGDGYDDILISAWGNDEGGTNAGQTYIILGNASGWSMDTSLSSVDGSFWGEDSEDFSGRAVAGAGDVNSDGYDDILIGAFRDDDGGNGAGQTYLILGKASGWAMDINLSNADTSFWGEAAGDGSGYSVAGAGDVNDDGFDDILIGAIYNSENGIAAGQTYLIFGEPFDIDNDGVPDDKDAFPHDIAASLDTDGDGFPDEWNRGMSMEDSTSVPHLTLDGFPEDPSEWVDTDGDGHGDNGDSFPEDPAASRDRDGDGYPADWNNGMSESDSTTGLHVDAFALDPAASVDSDADGYPDAWNPGMSGDDSTSNIKLVLDAFPDDPTEWLDTDGDGYGDNSDVFPNDPIEWADRDEDGHGDNSDVFPDNPLEWHDTDSDGHGDNSDAFPNDPLEWLDTDGDTHGDNGDAFSDDPSEWLDGDEDGHGDNSDNFPQDPFEWIDSDGDGHGDNGDAFPDNPLEWLDTDVDTHGDNGDAFPEDPLEWNDADDDGHGDNSDAFPNDKDEWVDTDGDGSGDNGDAFPDDAAASVDSDGDGYPDEWNAGKSKKDSTTGLKIDQLPNNPEEWKKEEESPSFGLVGALMAILVAALVAYNRRMHL